jgi:hypothetical protein
VDIGDDHLDAHRLGARPDDRNGLREDIGVDHERARSATRRPPHQRHRLGSGCGLIEEGRVGGRQASEVPDHGLEVEEGLESSL